MRDAVAHRQTPTQRRAIGAMSAVAIAAILVAAWPMAARSIVWNITSSAPLGLYQRTSQPPAPGRLAVFPAPASAFPYADRHLAYLRHVPLLKRIVAGPGDVVCAIDDQILVNGREQGRALSTDREGRTLPRWRGCRPLAAGELFALSTFAAKSFDSRYFGPVPTRSVIGVYRPLLTWSEAR